MVTAIDTLREAPDSPFGPGDSDRYYAALAKLETLLQAAERVLDLDYYHREGDPGWDALDDAVRAAKGQS